VDDEKKPLQRLPSYWGTALLWGGLFFLAAVLLGLWIFERPSLQAVPSSAPGTDAALDKHSLDVRPILVLDAGHGGIDGGAVGGGGTWVEAVLNQEMVERVMALLEPHAHELIWMQAHEQGTYATPMARANTAAENDADLLVSLHLNADTTAATRGFQCFPAPPGRVHHAQSMRFAEVMARRAGEAGAHVMGEGGVFYAYYVKNAGGYYTKEILDSAGADTEKPRSDESFGVLDYAGCPAVLVELWHISSPVDMAAFNNETGKAQMARAVYLAICEYFALQPSDGQAVGPAAAALQQQGQLVQA
jgi:N-acetylmuramoyl-L-alanine amidase